MKRILLVAACATVALIIVSSCNPQPADASLTAAISHDSLVTRGRYLVISIGCSDCHSPKKMGPNGPEVDSSLLLSGHPASMPIAAIDTANAKNWLLFNGMLTAAAGPWGVSFSANLTSDSTGIGNWTEEQFTRALRQGKAKGLANNRMLLPPMPWQNFANLTDLDIKSIFAFLKSTRPIRNVVPAPIPPVAFSKK